MFEKLRRDLAQNKDFQPRLKVRILWARRQRWRVWLTQKRWGLYLWVEPRMDIIY